MIWVIFLVGRFVCCGLLGEVARLCELLLAWLVLGFLIWWFGWFWVGFCWWSYLCALGCGLWFRFLGLGGASSRILVLDLGLGLWAFPLCGFALVGFGIWLCGWFWGELVGLVVGIVGWRFAFVVCECGFLVFALRLVVGLAGLFVGGVVAG